MILNFEYFNYNKEYIIIGFILSFYKNYLFKKKTIRYYLFK